MKVESPVKGFSGEVVGVVFADGHAETDDANAIGYFRRHGYRVTDDAKKRKSK